jgi:transposase
MNVMIGIDPHKASHTAVAIGRDEDQIACVKVRATLRQVDQLLTWAEPFEKRTWAIESVGGLGYLLAQQLVARGEDVVDVPATLASRIRVLATKRSNKNDPNDAHSIAVAACGLRRCAKSSRPITPRSSDSSQSATETLGGSGPESSAGCTPSAPSSCRAESPRRCTFPTPRRSWRS